MARPREFDLDQVIDRAIQVFWRLGYEGAALPDLLTGMGLTRGSFYKAFTQKKALFLLVLDRYEETEVAEAEALLTAGDPKDGRDRIRRLFANVAAGIREGDRRGCLLCSAAAGPSATDPDIAAKVTLGLERMTNAFAQALASSNAPGQDQEHQALADLLTTQYVGLRVLARSIQPVAALDRSMTSVDYVLRTSDGV